MSTEFAHLYLASKCFCEHKIGFSKNNGIMCEKNGGLERHTYCTDDEWCIGATDKIEATYHVESLCVKGNYWRIFSKGSNFISLKIDDVV